MVPPQRFRVTNPGPPQSPSPPPIFTASPTPPPLRTFSPTPSQTAAPGSRRSSAASSKGLPPRPKTSPSQPPSVASAKRQSIISSPSPKRPTTGNGPPSTRGSVAQAEGEESEAYFVRNTYALLDVTGVRGDGYEEGIERTRAKLGHDRRSVQLAVKNDAKEEVTGEIPQKELEVLKNVDR